VASTRWAWAPRWACRSASRAVASTWRAASRHSSSRSTVTNPSPVRSSSSWASYRRALCGYHPSRVPRPAPHPRSPSSRGRLSCRDDVLNTVIQSSLDAGLASCSPEGVFDAGLRRWASPLHAASLLPGLLAASRTGLAPAGGHELACGSPHLSWTTPFWVRCPHCWAHESPARSLLRSVLLWYRKTGPAASGPAGFPPHLPSPLPSGFGRSQAQALPTSRPVSLSTT